MNPSRLALTLTLSVICANVTAAGAPPFALLARDPGVKRWIWYQILGPQNHPLPIVYISTQHFKTMRNEYLIVLSPARYDIVSAYTHARLARPDCPGKKPAVNVNIVEIAEHEENHTQRCVLPRPLVCDYLSGVVKLSGVNWTGTERRPINYFMAEAFCSDVQ